MNTSFDWIVISSLSLQKQSKAVMSAASLLRVLLLAVLNLIVIPRAVAPVVLPVALKCYNSTGDPGSYNYGSADFNTVAFTNSGRYAHTYYTDITYANYGTC